MPLLEVYAICQNATCEFTQPDRLFGPGRPISKKRTDRNLIMGNSGRRDTFGKMHKILTLRPLGFHIPPGGF